MLRAAGPAHAGASHRDDARGEGSSACLEGGLGPWGGGGEMVRRGSSEAALRRLGLPGCRERPEWVWVGVEVAEGP